VFSLLRGRSPTSELTIPRNLRGRFRGFVRVGGVRDRAFQHSKIALSTLNPGVQYIELFVQYTGPQLVKYCPGSILDAGLEWLSRSDFEPGCLRSLVRRRLFALLGTRVRVLASPSPKILQKSSKSEKTVVRETRCPVYWSFCPVYWTSVQFTAFLVQFTAFPSSILDAVRRLVCSFPLAVILKCCLEPLLCLFGSLGTRTLVSTLQVQLLNLARIPTAS